MTIYANKDGKLEFEGKNSQKNIKNQPKIEEKMNEPSNSGNTPINGENLESKIIPEPVRIVTSLSRVDQKAIQNYANAVGQAFNIPEELRQFAAYFCSVSYKRESNEVFPDRGMLKLSLQNKMRGKDFLESLRVILSNPTEDTIIDLTGKNISSYNSEESIIIANHIFPEYGLLQNLLNKCKIKRTNQFIELLKVPQRARTFYAGAITHHLSKGLYLETFRVPLNNDSENIPMLNISSQHIAEYATKNHIEDYAQYVKLLGEKRIY
jgi:hypothetical protein